MKDHQTNRSPLGILTATALALGTLGDLTVIAPGCAVVAGAAAGVGTIVYFNGDLESVEEASLDDAWSATQKAIKDLEFIVTESKKDALSAEHVSKTAREKTVKVTLRKETDKTTRITIRVSFFGDEDVSREVLNAIKSHL